MIQGLIPVLRTWDFEASIAFYQSVLGFECVSRNDELRWAQLKRDNSALMLSGPNDHLGETEALEDFDYGMREFAIYDNNGYLLQFGQSLQAD